MIEFMAAVMVNSGTDGRSRRSPSLILEGDNNCGILSGILNSLIMVEFIAPVMVKCGPDGRSRRAPSVILEGDDYCRKRLIAEDRSRPAGSSASHDLWRIEHVIEV